MIKLVTLIFGIIFIPKATVTLSKSGFKLSCLDPNNTTVSVLVYGY